MDSLTNVNVTRKNPTREIGKPPVVFNLPRFDEKTSSCSYYVEENYFSMRLFASDFQATIFD